MANNALGTLFGGIADAIRAKTGATDTMKPADFPDKIAQIETTSPYTILDGTEVTLDLSAGDQTVTLPDGTATTAATIKKPDTLLPENIRSGVNIAGILGTLTASASGGSSGGGGITFKSGSFTPTGNVYTVNHGMEVVPDMIIVYADSLPAYGYLDFAFGFSESMYAACDGLTSYVRGVMKFGSQETIYSNAKSIGFESPDMSDGNVSGHIRNVTAQSFKLGGNEAFYNQYVSKLNQDASYSWIAVSGLIR